LALALVFGLGGPLMGLGAHRLAASVELGQVSALCGEYFTERSTGFARELDETIEEVEHLRLLFLIREEVTRDQFGIFARGITGRHTAIVAVEWAPRVAADERDAHEREARAEGLQGYAIRALTPRGGTTAAPPRPEYYPVFYVEPLAPNRAALGLDLSSEGTRRSALERAAESSEPSISDPIDLVQAQDHAKGFLVMLPVSKASGPASPPARADIDGFVILVVRIRGVFRDILDAGGMDGAPAMPFELSDVDANGRPVVLEASRSDSPSLPYGDWSFARTFDVGGQQWRLKGRPTSAYVAKHQTRGPLLLGVGVFLVWELLGGLALAAARHARDAASQKQARLFETSLSSLAEGIVVADASGHFVLFNPTAEKALGLGSRDVGVPEWSATYGCFYPDGRTPFPSEQLPLARALRGEEASEELYIRNQNLPEGAWIHVSGTPLRDQTGALDGGIVVFRDITAAKRAEEQLRGSIKQLEDLRYAVDQATLVTVTDRAGDITYVNGKFCEVSGYSQEELLGRNHRFLKSDFHPKAFFDGLWGTVSSGRVWRGRICNRTRDGRYFWVDTTIVPLLSDEKPERYMALRTDITEHMQREAELERLSNAVEQTADTIFITNRDGFIEYVNPAFEETTGFSREEAIGQTPRILRSGKQPPEYYERLWKTILAGEVFRGAPVNSRKNGELYHAEQTITPIKDSEGRIVHFVSVLKDVTDRIRIARQEIEMRYASEVQERLFPVAAPVRPGLDVAGTTVPALATCGDYYDFLALQDGRLGVVVGDVSGHGLGPALIMAETRAYVQVLSGSYPDPVAS
jgi:PAS domain S-box-containing protein